MEEQRRERKKEGKKRENHRRAQKGTGSRSGFGREGGAKDTKMRKVDSEVYTVRRDLINPPKRLSLLLVLLFLLHGRMRYVRRLCALEGGASFE